MRPLSRDEVEADLAEAMREGNWSTVEAYGAELDRFSEEVHPDLLGAALWYAHHGLHVFPVQPGSKVPHPHTRGVLEATTDPDRIRAWWDRWPGSNVALATGHLVDVVDFDGEEAHRAWGDRYGGGWAGLTPVATASTPRPGGFHLYVPASGKGNRAAMLPSLDYRGLGGYVVAPPSRTDLGTYRFLRPPHFEDL